MKKCVWILCLAICLPMLSMGQAFETQQLLLNVEKLSQLRQMLADLKKGYEIVYKGYTTIKNISEGNFDLHHTFLDGLLQVNPVVRSYKKVADIVSFQLRIVSEYKSSFKRFRESRQFTIGEIDHIGKVYANLFDESLKNIDALLSVITSGVLRMSDDERLKTIDGLHEDMQDKLTFLRHYNNKTSLLALQRFKTAEDIQKSKNFFTQTH